LGEARNITWADCDFIPEEIVVLGDPEEGTKNSELRRVPMIEEMRQLLQGQRYDLERSLRHQALGLSACSFDLKPRLWLNSGNTRGNA